MVNDDHSKSFIHRYYILLKIHYFVSHSSIASFSPILDMILANRGLSFVEIFNINLMVPFVIFLTNPLIGYIADHSHRFRLTFNITFGLAFILFVIMFLIPSIKIDNIRGEFHQSETNEYSMIFCANEEFARKCSLRNECGCIYQAKCISIYHSKERQIFHFNFTMNSQNIKEESKDLSLVNEKHSTCQINYRVLVKNIIDQNKGRSLNKIIK